MDGKIEKSKWIDKWSEILKKANNDYELLGIFELMKFEIIVNIASAHATHIKEHGGEKHV